MLKHKKIVLPDIPSEVPKRRRDDGLDALMKLLGDEPHKLYVSLQGYRLEGWERIVRRFEENPDDPHAAYYYIANHPMFWTFSPWRRHKVERIPGVHERHLDHESGWKGVEITPHRVNPATRSIDDDESLNTHLEWWFEFGPSLFNGMTKRGTDWITHWGMDHRLMGGADTYEEAVCAVAKNIHKGYGNDRRQVVKKWKDVELPSFQETKE